MQSVTMVNVYFTCRITCWWTGYKSRPWKWKRYWPTATVNLKSRPEFQSVLSSLAVKCSLFPC